MSNPPDSNEYLRLFLQLQQQQQGTAPANNPNAPSINNAPSSLGNILSGLNPAATAGEPSAPAPAYANTSHPAPLPAPNEEGRAQQQQLLLASAQLLANVNPALAKAAVEHAMALAAESAAVSEGHGVS